jgi:hypothetical protein
MISPSDFSKDLSPLRNPGPFGTPCDGGIGDRGGQVVGNVTSRARALGVSDTESSQKKNPRPCGPSHGGAV